MKEKLEKLKIKFEEKKARIIIKDFDEQIEKIFKDRYKYYKKCDIVVFDLNKNKIYLIDLKLNIKKDNLKDRKVLEDYVKETEEKCEHTENIIKDLGFKYNKKDCIMVIKYPVKPLGEKQITEIFIKYKVEPITLASLNYLLE